MTPVVKALKRAKEASCSIYTTATYLWFPLLSKMIMTDSRYHGNQTLEILILGHKVSFTVNLKIKSHLTLTMLNHDIRPNKKNTCV